MGWWDASHSQGALWRSGLLSDRGRGDRQKSKESKAMPTFTKHLPWAGPPIRWGTQGSHPASGHCAPHCTAWGAESWQMFPVSIGRTFEDVCVSWLPLQEEPLLRREAGPGIPQPPTCKSLPFYGHWAWHSRRQSSPPFLPGTSPRPGWGSPPPPAGIPYQPRTGHLNSPSLVFPFLSQMAESSGADFTFVHSFIQQTSLGPLSCAEPCPRPWGHRSGLLPQVVRWGWQLRTAHH